MKINANEISKVIELELEKYHKEIDIKEVGNVLQLGDGIARIYGLKNVMSGELLKFPNNVLGMALNLEESNIGAILFGDYTKIKEGDEVISTGRLLEVPVGDELLGRVVNPLGMALDGKGKINSEKHYPIEREAPKMFDRNRVNIPLETGIKAIDGMIPIGKGQRELIIGDRHTGKTALAIDSIINQKGKDVICVYVAIGQKQSTVARIVDKLDSAGALSYTVVVAATAANISSLQYMAPYAGCAIAEYFMDKGKHVLIVYDDLSKHAIAYREISLLLRRPPGREAYPGDIFYLHSRLLERAAMLSHKIGGSLTALPIVETLAGDVSAYIPTNIISITDGQIYLESSLFNADIRPAINAGLSVSRVGGDAQTKAMKQVASKIKLELAQYREIASFSQFNSDMDKITKAQLERGLRITEVLKQDQYYPLSTEEQIVIFYAVINGYLDSINKESVKRFEKELLQYIKVTNKEILNKIKEEKSLSEDLKNLLNLALDDFKKGFSLNV